MESDNLDFIICNSCGCEIKQESEHCPHCGNIILKSKNEEILIDKISKPLFYKIMQLVSIIIIISVLISTFTLIYSREVKNKAIFISFNSRGGTFCESIETVGNELIELPTSERDGYIFMGWYTSQDWTNQVFNTTYKNKTISNHITLYARWGQIKEIQIDSTNYKKYIDLKIRNAFKFDYDINPYPYYLVTINCLANDPFIKILSISCTYNGQILKFDSEKVAESVKVECRTYPHYYPTTFSNIKGTILAKVLEN